MNQDLTIPSDQPAEVIVVLDRSGSMEMIWSDTIGGLKSFVDDYRQTAAHAKFTLVLFNSRVATLLASVPMSEVPPIEAKGEMVPTGNTAMLDGICQAIDDAGQRFSKYDDETRSKLRVVVAIISDGMENSSREHTYADAKRRIERQSKEFGWQFTFLGADQDAILAGAQIGIDADNAAGFVKTSGGIMQALGRSSEKARMYAASGASRSMNYTDQDREALKTGKAENK